MLDVHAVVESVKFVLRMAVLVGVPATLSAVVATNPKWGVGIGFVLALVDKYVHKLPNQYRGLLPF